VPCWTSQGETVSIAGAEKRRRNDTHNEISEKASERKSLVIYPEGDVVGDTNGRGEMKQVASVALTGCPTNVSLKHHLTTVKELERVEQHI
jgi:hypothetical protein